ncbi:ribosome biogenesis protein WDR12 homolog [Daphnia carinata]|uniref:ribosome biogenesis protein WDR12 homolog n=1 Tax=Daphnia carinata TaxID=120202 RepID=UPI00257D99F6|nr:ribosome biogenesis protein WDR12 homolog [Daphnia carinata]
MAALKKSMSTDERQIQVRFVTKQEKYALPEAPFSIPCGIKADLLSVLVNNLLRETRETGWEEVEFDFLISGEFVRLPLVEHLKLKDINTEVTIDVEYIERFPAPEPEDSLNHDDWVSAAHCLEDWILTGSYDNTLHIWKTDGTHKTTIPGHCGPIKGVRWIEIAGSLATFASVSHDQTIMIWTVDLETYAVERVHIGRGHERSIECVDVDKNSSFLATGGWDHMLKIWAATSESVLATEIDDGENHKLSTVNPGKSLRRTPLMTLPGHKEAISSVVWTESNEIFSSSWDHTIKLWDAELGGLKSEIVGNKSFFCVSYSPLNQTLVSASADRHVRLYDARSQEGSIVKATFTSHVGWVSTVCWSTTHERLFISGGHDNILKLWDSRRQVRSKQFVEWVNNSLFCSPKAPLYDMVGHEGKILCADWSNPSLMVSGATDNTLKIFRSQA